MMWTHLLGGLGFLPESVCMRKAGFGDSSSFSSSLLSSSPSFTSRLTLLVRFLPPPPSFPAASLGVAAAASGLAVLRPRLAAELSAAWRILEASFWTNWCMRRGSRMFSSGSHVENLHNNVHPGSFTTIKKKLEFNHLIQLKMVSFPYLRVRIRQDPDPKRTFYAVLRIRIRVFLGILAPDPLVRGTDPSIIKQK